MIMENGGKAALEMSTLLLCADAQFLASARGVLNQLRATPKIVGDCAAAIAAIEEYEFDAILMDWREMRDLEDFLSAVRRSQLNRECIRMAIIRDPQDLRQAFAAGIHLLIHKPASAVQIERCLRVAYCASVARRVKRHREPVNIVASLNRPAQPFAEVTIANLSERGARVKAAFDSGTVTDDLRVGAEVDLRFAAPETGDVLQCAGKVVWIRPEGDAGIRFSSVPDHEQQILEMWLTECVERSRAERCERLRAACA